MRSTHAPIKVRASKRVRNHARANRAVQICSAPDVRAFWLKVRDVPRRTEGRSKKQYERYYLGVYLLALADHGVLRYPLKVLEGDSPDFMVVGKSGQESGLEVTRATDENLQAEITRAERDEPNGGAFLASPHGWVGDELERDWCALVREAVEKKLPKFVKYRPASQYDLLVPDDTRMGAGDRRKVIEMLTPWARDLKQREIRLGKISVVASLDVLYDIGGASLVLPFVEWSSPRSKAAAKGESFSERVEYAGQFVAQNAIRAHRAAGRPLYFMNSRGKLVKETADGRRFEVHISEAGEESTVQELSRR